MSTTVWVVYTARDLGVVTCHRQQTFNGWSDRRHLPYCLLPAPPTTYCYPFSDTRCSQDNSSGVHHLSPRLLQCHSVPHHGRPIATSAVCRECCVCLVSRARRSDHITPVLRRLHWLPVKHHIQFKLALLVYKSLHGSVPRYLSDDCQLVSDVGRRWLHSSDVSTCMVPRTQTSCWT